MRLLEQGVSYEDEATKLDSNRWMYIDGPPGSGKTALLLEMAIKCAGMGLDVLIVCPIGTNVYGFKSQLPDSEGIEKVSVDIIQGVLKYKRPGADSQVAWAPPSALRRIDVLLCDEASQYEDLDWERFFKSVFEQPHKPYCAVVADFQQLQPVTSGSLCRFQCTGIDSDGVKKANGMGDQVI